MKKYFKIGIKSANIKKGNAKLNTINQIGTTDKVGNYINKNANDNITELKDAMYYGSYEAYNDYKKEVNSNEFIYSKELSLKHKIPLYALILTFSLSFLIHTKVLLICFINLTNILYLFLIIFKNYLFTKGIILNKESNITKTDTENSNNIKDKTLPYYSVLLPLYKEAGVVEQLIQNIQSLDYPKEKLQVIIIIESDDIETLDVINMLTLPKHFNVVIVPNSFPKTKAKACNYALKYVYGEFLTIWDAEDQPDTQQLIKALEVLKYDKANFGCVQARLTYYNAYENCLSKMFTMEYATLFNYILPAISNHNLPIPLGGSSNHFRVSILKNIGGWDSHNVTEDAELGIRMAINKIPVGTINSYTYEECPLSLSSWIKQRARWLKGHLYTYWSYMTSPVVTYKKLGILGFICFNYMLGAAPISLLLTPFSFVIIALNYCNIVNFPQPWCNITYIFSITNLILGITTLLYNSISITHLPNCKNNKVTFSNMKKVALLYPLYFTLHIAAAILALLELIKKPYYWNKTTHGISKIKKI